MIIVPPSGGWNHVSPAGTGRPAPLTAAGDMVADPMVPPSALRRPGALVTALLLAASVAACGDKDSPLEVRLKEDTAKQTVLGFPAVATKNTTRIGGKDPTADAGGAASAVYPGATRGTRPRALTFVDSGDWRAGIAAAVFGAPPLRTPILLTDGGDIPEATSKAVDSTHPTGARALAGAQALEVGKARAPDSLRARRVTGKDPFELAAAIDALATDLAGRASQNVIIVSKDEPRFAMPAAAWAAKSGDSVLFTERDQLPPATRTALRKHELPGIYILGPKSVVGANVERDLQRLGRVRRIAGPGPAETAVAFARYSNADFGWGLRDPGHGIVFANAGRTLDAAAGAILSASGKYGPLLLIEDPDELSRPVESFLLDIQPGYRFDPVRGVYNHAWVMGDESAISVPTQARIDELSEIVKIRDEGL
jgi:putative cell wall binding repeat protein